MKYQNKLGYIKFSKEEDLIIINMITVRKERQKNGIELMQNFIKFIKKTKKDVEVIALASYPHNRNLKKETLTSWYEKQGFIVVYKGSEREPDLLQFSIE